MNILKDQKEKPNNNKNKPSTSGKLKKQKCGKREVSVKS
tara:strand:- start:48 stop:164 length:117 start_codon:yes stop_codon:yes gene_type:complete